MGINEPDNLFLGITNPDFAANMETFWVLVGVVDADILVLEGSTADLVSTFALILSSYLAYMSHKQNF